jgi:hypothetical protein
MTSTTQKSALTSAIDQPRPAVDEIRAINPVNRKNFSTRRHFGVRSSKCPNRMLPIANRLAMAATSIQTFMRQPTPPEVNVW